MDTEKIGPLLQIFAGPRKKLGYLKSFPETRKNLAVPEITKQTPKNLDGNLKILTQIRKSHQNQNTFT